MRKASRHCGSFSNSIPCSMRFAATCARFSSSVAGLATAGRRFGSLRPLLRDPGRVLCHEIAELGIGRRTVGKLCEGIHRQFDVFQVRRCNPLYLRFGNPAGADGVAMAVSQNCFGGDAVPDGILTRIAILQVGDSFVPVVAFQAAQVRPGERSLLRSGLQAASGRRRLRRGFRRGQACGG